MKTLKERIEIEQAYLDGKLIEFKPKGSPGSWYFVPQNEKNIVFQWEYNDYRIKQEPMEFWVNVYEDLDYGLFHNKDNADFAANGIPSFIKTIKMREVTDEE